MVNAGLTTSASETKCSVAAPSVPDFSAPLTKKY
jgi:hypothetical protein